MLPSVTVGLQCIRLDGAGRETGYNACVYWVLWTFPDFAGLIYGASSRNRTGTPLREQDFKS